MSKTVHADETTAAAADRPGTVGGSAADGPGEGSTEHTGFTVELENFSGPFDLLLSLISKRRLDVTEIALAEVTDEFLSYTTALHERADLAEISEFLLIAATLLDLKTARLLPQEEGEDVLDLELLEARDLLFARLLQYKAYKSVSAYFAEAMTRARVHLPRDVGLEEAFADVLPPLELRVGPQELAGIFATVVQRDHTPPSVAVDHIHLPLVSVSEQRGIILGLLRSADIDFQELIDSAADTLTIVARFLALLELFKVGLCTLDQDEPLGVLRIGRTETDTDGIDLRTEGTWSADDDDREDTTDGR